MDDDGTVLLNDEDSRLLITLLNLCLKSEEKNETSSSSSQPAAVPKKMEVTVLSRGADENSRGTKRVRSINSDGGSSQPTSRPGVQGRVKQAVRPGYVRILPAPIKNLNTSSAGTSSNVMNCSGASNSSNVVVANENPRPASSVSSDKNILYVCGRCLEAFTNYPDFNRHFTSKHLSRPEQKPSKNN